MSVKLLSEHHLEFLSLKGGCTGSSESALVKMPHCWKPHVAAHIKCEVGTVQFEVDITKCEELNHPQASVYETENYLAPSSAT